MPLPLSPIKEVVISVRHRKLPGMWLSAPILMLVVAVIRLVAAGRFQWRHGPLASYGADIWYFIGVARGSQHLFWGDPLQWLLPRFGGWGPATLFYGLLAASNLFHLLSVYLLFRVVRTATGRESVAFWSALAYSLFTTSFNFSTASFHHQQVVLPILILLVGLVIREWNVPPVARHVPWMALPLAILTLAMGPDGLVVLTWAGLCFGVRRWGRVSAAGRERRIHAAIVLAIIGLFLVTAPYLGPLVNAAARSVRGIDLDTQRTLHVADLEPFGWENLWASYGLLSFLLVAVILWSGWRGFFPEMALVIVGLLFALRASRFYFVAEIGLALMVGRWLAVQEEGARWRLHLAGGSLCALLMAAVFWHGLPCFYPGTIAKVVRRIPASSSRPPLVLCTPTYGFLIQGLAGARTTSDWHRLDPRWTDLAARPVRESVEELKKRGVTHCFFTSYDFRVEWAQTPGGPVPLLMASGGFERSLPSDLERVETSLVAVALSDQPRIGRVRRLAVEVDPVSRQKTVLLVLE